MSEAQWKYVFEKVYPQLELDETRQMIRDAYEEGVTRQELGSVVRRARFVDTIQVIFLKIIMVVFVVNCLGYLVDAS